MTEKEWLYDGSIITFPIRPGEVWSCQFGEVMVHDIYSGLPYFMLEADCLFIDPPWNIGQENSYRTKAKLTEKSLDFKLFLDALFRGIDEIAPQTCFIEIGKQHVQEIENRLATRFPHTSTFQSTYYHSAKNICYIVRGSGRPPAADYSGLDEENAIAQICEKELYNVIGDLCMGRGLVGINAFKSRRRFVGTELNPARLAVMVNKIFKLGGEWSINGTRYFPQSSQ